MSSRDLLTIFLKAMGFFQLLWGLVSLPIALANAMEVFSSPTAGLRWLKLGSLAMPITPLLCAWIMLKYGEQVSRWLIREDQALPFAFAEGWFGTLQGVLIRVTGIVILSYGIPNVVRYIPHLLFLPPGVREIQREVWGGMGAAVASIVVGIHLLGGGNLLLQLGGYFAQKREDVAGV